MNDYVDWHKMYSLECATNVYLKGEVERLQNIPKGHTMKTLSIAFISVFLTILALQLLTATAPLRPVPRCQEDVVLVGTGDFNRGRWTSYACGPAVDDYIGGY